MPNYESDSSSEGEGDYTTTNVTLGYATTDSTGDDISHIGGHPTWLDPKQTPPSALAKCKVCNGYLSLLLQLNADLQQYFPNDQRRLHVLCCRKKACSKKLGSIRAFREVRRPQESKKTIKDTTYPSSDQKPARPAQDLGHALFGGNPQPNTSRANPFSVNSSTQSASTNPFASIASPSTLAAKPAQPPINDTTIEPPTETFASKLNISTAKPSTSPPQQEQWPNESSFPPPFPSFYLEAYPEELEPEQPTSDQAGPSKASQYDIDDATTSGATDKDTFESTLDKTFQRFSDRIAQNPEQVLRYEFKGQPLLYSGADGVASRFVVPHGKAGAVRGLPRCESCGAQRVFELQLVPGLIYELEKDEMTSLEEGMEWGTIIVGTCVNSCGEAGIVSFREEWVGVQWEESVVRK